MSRPALISLPLVESVERYGDALADASRDGVIDPEEQRRLIRLFAAITHRVEGRPSENTIAVCGPREISQKGQPSDS